MIILFIGVQASGKGTQAKIIAQKKGFAHISTGDLLRAATGKLKEEIDTCTKNGKLVNDELILSLLKERMKQPDCKNGIILDGYPRNLKQAKELEKIEKIEKIFEIYISDNTAKKRLMGRWNCKRCGRSYNLITSPKPKEEGICDACQIPLCQREDDTDEKAIEERLKTYHKETEPIINKYGQKAIRIDGEQTIEKITQEIIKRLP